MHQTTDEQPLLDLKPEPLDDRAGRSIDHVLEFARQRSTQRKLDELSERRLPELAPREPGWMRLMWFAIAVAVVWANFYVVRSFWAPSHPGVDQNGYQVGGKLFSQTFSTGFKPSNPFSYVGWMWVQTPDGWVYPKYPLGVPVLDALCIWVSHNLHDGVTLSYLVSPVCTVLASAAMFLMLRMFASSFAAVMGTILLATNPVSLVLANNSNSHAPALAFTCWGILFLLWWMRYGSWWRGMIAGLLLGYALTIRYTEGLLILPIAAAMLTSIRYKPAREIRWWAASAWVVGIVVGGCCQTKIPVEGWHLTVPIVMLGLLITLTRRSRARQSEQDISQSGRDIRWIIASVWIAIAIVQCAFRAERDGAPPPIWEALIPVAMAGLTMRRRFSFSSNDTWGYIGEFVRSCVCGAIAWSIIRFPSLYSISKFKDPIGTMVVIDIIKLIGLGMIPILYAMQWRKPSTYLRPACVLVGWLIPVVALVAFNKCAMGSWTGYDTTNESEGFSWDYFIGKWDFMVGQVYNTGLFFIAPLGIAGMVLLYRKSARVATVMTLWFVPGILLYTAYYWGMNTNGVGYLRFFLTLFPPIVFCTAWMLDDISRRGIRRGSVAAPIMAGVVVAIAAGLNLYSSRGALERDYTIQANLADAGEHIVTRVQDAYQSNPARRALMFGESRGFLNYVQYAANLECYSYDAFTTRGGNRMWCNQDPDAPNPLQKLRVDEMRKIYQGKSDTDLWKQGNAIVDQALADKRHVYAALPAPMMLGFKMRFSPKDYIVTTLEKWRDPVTMSDEGKKALLSMGPAALFMGGRTTPQSWELVEITKNNSPPPPAPVPAKPQAAKTVMHPTTKPTTRPAKALFEIK